MPSSVDLTVILCTHNPRGHFLERAMKGLASQTLSKDRWELLVIDNMSNPPVGGNISAHDHSNLRLIIEPQLGHTRARRTGISEAHSELIVFVDDDNVLAPDYLERAVEIATTHSFLGAWGGQIMGEFEVPPPVWLRSFLFCLALRPVTSTRWSNATDNYDTVPFGAGLCVRTQVARAWAGRFEGNSARADLGRKGTELASADDTDLGLTACDLGLGCGLFPSLCVTHLISKERLSLPYFERLMEGIATSALLLKHARDPIRQRERVNRMDRLVSLYRRYRMSPEERALHNAIDRGREAGYRRLGL